MRSAHDVADHTANTGVGSSKWFHCAGVVVCFTLQRKCSAWRKRNDARIANECAANYWRIDLFGSFSQRINE